MFDASEILFLDRAVDLHLLTKSQQGRLLSFQADLEPGMRATTLVVDAGLMTEDEVRQVLEAIESPSKRLAGGSMMRTAESMGRKSETQVKKDSRAAAGPIVNKYGVAMTPDELEDLLSDDAGSDTGKQTAEDMARLAAIATVVKDTVGGGGQAASSSGAGAASSGHHESHPAPSSANGIPDGWEVATDQYAGWVVGENGEWVQDPNANWQQDAQGNWVVLVPSKARQAFPMPGSGAQQAFPMPGGSQHDHSHYDDQPLWPESSHDRHDAHHVPADGQRGSRATISSVETYASKLAANADEIDALLVD